MTIKNAKADVPSKSITLNQSPLQNTYRRQETLPLSEVSIGILFINSLLFYN